MSRAALAAAAMFAAVSPAFAQPAEKPPAIDEPAKADSKPAEPPSDAPKPEGDTHSPEGTTTPAPTDKGKPAEPDAPRTGANGQPDEDDIPDLPQRTAKDAEGAPVPGQEHGRLDPIDTGDGAGRKIGRVALFVPKLVIEAVFAVPYFLGYEYDKHHLDELYYKTFFNSNRTIGLVPTASFETGFGASLGLRFQTSNVLGYKERLAAQATTGAILGDTYREGALVEAHTGSMISKNFEVGLVGDFDRRPADPFYGIGNSDLSTTKPAVLVDPRRDSTAYRTYHRYREARAALTADARPTPRWHFALTGSLTSLKYSDSDDSSHTPLTDVYNPDGTVGFVDGVQHAYGELEIRYDSRHRHSAWEPTALPSEGSMFAVFGGRVDRLDGGEDFWRYGVELQHYFHLATGPRMLIARFRYSAVSGDRDVVPFTELPTLGGGDFLRGYDFERFRDRIATFGSLQYEWDLSKFVAAYVFTDVGRVYDTAKDIKFQDMRMGYGIGLDLHGEPGFLTTASIASSIDGGLFLTLSFNPVTDARQRWR